MSRVSDEHTCPVKKRALPAIDACALHTVADDPANDEVLERAGLRKPSYFLLRPDGYIALAGGRIAAQDIERYFAGRGIRLSPQAQAAAALQGFASGA